jgi:hypothetical protein
VPANITFPSRVMSMQSCCQRFTGLYYKVWQDYFGPYALCAPARELTILLQVPTQRWDTAAVLLHGPRGPLQLPEVKHGLFRGLLRCCA